MILLATMIIAAMATYLSIILADNFNIAGVLSTYAGILIVANVLARIVSSPDVDTVDLGLLLFGIGLASGGVTYLIHGKGSYRSC